MSDTNMFTEALADIVDTKTDTTQEYNDLYEIYLAAELGDKTPYIISALATEPNKTPYKLLNEFISTEDQSTIRIEVGKNPVIMAHAIDRTNQEVGCIDMSPTIKSPLCEKITQETFDKLSRLRTTLEDKKLARLKVQDRMKTAI